MDHISFKNVNLYYIYIILNHTIRAFIRNKFTVIVFTIFDGL